MDARNRHIYSTYPHTHTQELHSSLEKMRPNLFRMASELKQNEEGMSEILQTNDDLARVLDQYKRAFGDDKSEEGASSATASETPTTNGASTSTSLVADSGAVGAMATDAKTTGATASDSNGLGSDILIDLADLNFGSSGPGQNAATASSTSGSLLDDLGQLGVLPPGSTSQDFVS